MLLVLSLVTVGCGGSTGVQLLGVCFSSLQGGLGEASFLALASFYDTPRALTAWSSGTGFAGIFGYAWVFFLKFLLGLSFRATLLTANLLGLVFLWAYFRLLSAPYSRGNGRGGSGAAPVAYSPLPSSQQQQLQSSPSPNGTGDGGARLGSGGGAGEEVRGEEEQEEWGGRGGGTGLEVGVSGVESRRPPKMTVGERLRFTLSLWRFTVPLMLVYFAEVCMCVGVLARFVVWTIVLDLHVFGAYFIFGGCNSQPAFYSARHVPIWVRCDVFNFCLESRVWNKITSTYLPL